MCHARMGYMEYTKPLRRHCVAAAKVPFPVRAARVMPLAFDLHNNAGVREVEVHSCHESIVIVNTHLPIGHGQLVVADELKKARLQNAPGRRSICSPLMHNLP
jgi:hypothetical protein